MEKTCSFSSDGLILESLFEEKDPHRAVVITHPHPLYGGSMHNPVVNCIREAYLAKGYSTLRFNFRGTGKSTGDHDHGRGEMRDVLGAQDYLKSLGYTAIDLAGYSFGAWVNLMTAREEHGFTRLVMVSPPVDFIEFQAVSDISALDLVISGDQDEYASCAHIKNLLKDWNKNAIFSVIPGADHFYSGVLGSLRKMLEEHL